MWQQNQTSGSTQVEQTYPSRLRRARLGITRPFFTWSCGANKSICGTNGVGREVRSRVRQFTSDELNSFQATRRVWPGHLFLLPPVSYRTARARNSIALNAFVVQKRLNSHAVAIGPTLLPIPLNNYCYPTVRRRPLPLLSCNAFTNPYITK